MGMDDLGIDQVVLQQIRSLNDRDLAKLIAEISEYGWPKAEPLLRLLMMEGESHE
jgi:hypothetical protein